jgi:hypothetical protein
VRRFFAFALLAVAPAVFAADAPALRGIETGDLDRSVAPCSDFHEFANGAWRAANPIPPSMSPLEPSLGAGRRPRSS